MPKAVKTTCIICCLCFMVCIMAIPANAVGFVENVIDPADHIADISYNGDDKIIHYNFDDIAPYMMYVDDIYSWEGFLHLEHYISGGSLAPIWAIMPLGASEDFSEVNVLDVSSINPGETIDFSYELWVTVMLSHLQSERIENISVNVYWDCNFYDEDFIWCGVVSRDYSYDLEYSGDSVSVPGQALKLETTLPVYAAYIEPFASIAAEITLTDGTVHHETNFSFSGGHFDVYASISAVKSESSLMTAINNKLDELNSNMDSVNDKLDQILQQPEQEKNDATQGANDAFSGVVDVVPDHSEGLVDAFSGLAASLSYNGTVAKLDIPAVSMPGIDGLFDGFIVMQPQELDFEVYFQMLPENLLLLVQSLFTAALIIFCFKELYSTIQYCLTLRG